MTADGAIDLEALRAALREGKGRTLVAVMTANNETGVIQPIAEVSALVREAGALLLVDAVPAAGKIPLDASLCDYMRAVLAHALGGPQGVGALLMAEGAPLAPQIVGGGQHRVGCAPAPRNLVRHRRLCRRGPCGARTAMASAPASLPSARPVRERRCSRRAREAVIFGAEPAQA